MFQHYEVKCFVKWQDYGALAEVLYVLSLRHLFNALMSLSRKTVFFSPFHLSFSSCRSLLELSNHLLTFHHRDKLFRRSSNSHFCENMIPTPHWQSMLEFSMLCVQGHILKGDTTCTGLAKLFVQNVTLLWEKMWKVTLSEGLQVTQGSVCTYLSLISINVHLKDCLIQWTSWKHVSA